MYFTSYIHLILFIIIFPTKLLYILIVYFNLKEKQAVLELFCQHHFNNHLQTALSSYIQGNTFKYYCPNTYLLLYAQINIYCVAVYVNLKEEQTDLYLLGNMAFTHIHI